jgi:leucyl aminopeptidase
MIKPEQYNCLSLKVAPKGEALSNLSVVFQPSTSKPSPSAPGKAIGDLLLVNQENGTQKVIVSLGSIEKINPDSYRQAGGLFARWCRQTHAGLVDLDVSQFYTMDFSNSLFPLCEGLLLGAYYFDQYKTTNNEPAEVTIVLRNTSDPKIIKDYIQRLSIITKWVGLARSWSHEPANVINPITLADWTSILAKDSPVTFKVLDEKELSKLNAGGILAVGQGSKTPSRLILLEYPGKGAKKNSTPTVLIGKALTFDSGGYSIKDTANIQGMKYDKCGGVTVIATVFAAAELGLDQPIVGIVAAAENMLSADSYRPDDILHMLSGKTVEIISTDAEGRLVLADALAYAQKFYHPLAMIDLATLTGGVVTALGRVRAGILSNNDALANNLLASGERTHELLWRLPLDEEYDRQITGDDADIKNSGGREASPVIGGIFLKQFVNAEVPWAHLDIAGVADIDKDQPYAPKGATGFGVRLLIDFLSQSVK